MGAVGVLLGPSKGKSWVFCGSAKPYELRFVRESFTVRSKRNGASLTVYRDLVNRYGWEIDGDFTGMKHSLRDVHRAFQEAEDRLRNLRGRKRVPRPMKLPPRPLTYIMDDQVLADVLVHATLA